MAALANVAEHVDSIAQQKMIDEGVIPACLGLATSPLVDVRREVARCLALFGCRPESHDEMLRTGSPKHNIATTLMHITTTIYEIVG